MPTNQIPTVEEIQKVENRLMEMRRAREDAQKQLADALRSDDVINVLTPDQLVGLMKKIQNRIRGNHKRVRGSPVAPSLRAALESALIRQDRSLSQLSSLFNLSVSYISRVKKELRDAGKLEEVRNAYTDTQLKHQHQPETELASVA